METPKLMPYSPRAVVSYLMHGQKFAVKSKHYSLARQIDAMLQSRDYVSCYITLSLLRVHTPDLVCTYNKFYHKIHLNPN